MKIWHGTSIFCFSLTLFSHLSFSTSAPASSSTSGLYMAINAVYGNQTVDSISSQEQIKRNAQIDPMNPFKLDNDELGVGLAGGKNWVLQQFNIRTEIQYTYHGKLSGAISPAFPPPPAGIPEMATSFSANIKAQSIFANAFLGKPLLNGFSVYAGGGIGGAYKRMNATMAIDAPPWPATDSESHSSTHFAWQLGAGALYAINSKLSLNAGYFHTDLGQSEFGTFYSHPPAIPGRHVKGDHWVANRFILGVILFVD